MPGYRFKRLTTVSSNHTLSYGIQKALNPVYCRRMIYKGGFSFFLKPHKTATLFGTLQTLSRSDVTEVPKGILNIIKSDFAFRLQFLCLLL